MEDTSIGARLQQTRRGRGMTQEELAGRAGVSRDIVAKLEQGRRTTARMGTYVRISNALGIGLSDLFGRRERFSGADAEGILDVRNALLAVDDLPGIDLADDDGEPTALADLEATVRRAWGLYWRGDFGELAAMLPGLIGEARITERALGAPATGPLAQAFQLAADLMVHVGNDDLAMAAALRALGAAHRGNDELQHATIAGTASWVLLHQARLCEAEHVARAAAEKIEVVMSKATPEHLTVWGALLLSAAAPAAAAAKADEVREYIGLARTAAARWDEDRHDYWVSFGPTQAEMQACHTASVLGQPAEALKAAARVRREDLLHISWGAHKLDVAQALLDARRLEDATGALLESCSVSPEWFRHQPLARTLVGDIRDRHLTPAVKKLIRSVDMQ